MFGNLHCDFQAGADVVVVRLGLAHIVQQKGENQQVNARFLPPGWRGRAAVLLFRMKGVDGLDGAKGMLIDRVAMIVIADDQRFDGAEFREQQSEDAKFLHHAQRLGGMRTNHDLAQRRPALRPRKDQARHRGRACSMRRSVLAASLSPCCATNSKQLKKVQAKPARRAAAERFAR